MTRALAGRPLPDVLAAATPVRAVAYALDVGAVARLALTPDEVGPLLGMSGQQVRHLCKSGQLHARILYPESRSARYLIPVKSIIEFLEGGGDDVSADR